MKGGDIVDNAIGVEVGHRAAIVGVVAQHLDHAEIMRVNNAFHAIDAALDVLPALADLLGTEGQAHVVGIVKDHGKIVPDAIGHGRAGPSAGAVGAQGRGIKNPRGHIERVDVLLGDDVAGEGAVGAPGAQADLVVVRIVPEQRIHAAPGVAGLVGGFAGNNPANSARMHDAHRLLIGRVGAGLEIHQKDQFLLRGFAPALGHGLAAGHVHRNGLGAIDVLAGLDGRGGVFRVEIRRRLNHHRVELLFQKALVSGEAGEAPGLVHLELFSRRLRLVREIVRHGRQVVMAVFQEQVGDPRAAPAAADEAEVDFGIALGAAGQPRLGDGERQGRSPGRGQELPAGESGVGGSATFHCS